MVPRDRNTILSQLETGNQKVVIGCMIGVLLRV